MSFSLWGSLARIAGDGFTYNWHLRYHFTTRLYSAKQWRDFLWTLTGRYASKQVYAVHLYEEEFGLSNQSDTHVPCETQPEFLSPVQSVTCIQVAGLAVWHDDHEQTVGSAVVLWRGCNCSQFTLLKYRCLHKSLPGFNSLQIITESVLQIKLIQNKKIYCK
jgi:hypothetical protein